MKVMINCDYCGKPTEKYPCKVRKHNFCSRGCLSAFSSKIKNPQGYADLKDYTGMSSNLRRLNTEMNKTRMTGETKAKLRQARLNKGRGLSYEKTYGRHTHRIVAEKTLNRPLLPGEVVHHIDGNKRNNEPENLMVFESQKEHATHHKDTAKGGGSK